VVFGDFIFWFKLVGVWFVNQWMTSGKKKLQLVELGPGRGTLASDVLRVNHRLETFHYILLDVMLISLSSHKCLIQDKVDIKYLNE